MNSWSRPRRSSRSRNQVGAGVRGWGRRAPGRPAGEELAPAAAAGRPGEVTRRRRRRPEGRRGSGLRPHGILARTRPRAARSHLLNSAGRPERAARAGLRLDACGARGSLALPREPAPSSPEGEPGRLRVRGEGVQEAPGPHPKFLRGGGVRGVRGRGERHR